MAGVVEEARPAQEWGPVRRGFQVSLPGGERGCVEDIRLGDGVVELVVATGLFVRRLVSVRAQEIEAILPRARRIVVRDSTGAVADEGAAAGLETQGGIVRMPARHSSRIAPAPKEPA